LGGLVFLALGISASLTSAATTARVEVKLPDRSAALSVLTVERRQYLDARAVADVVSGEAQVDVARRRATLRVGRQAVVLRAGSATARIADRSISLSSPPRLFRRRFLVPLDLLPVVLAERYGREAVEWKPQQRLARVRSREATISQIRVGTYPTHTRVVMETVGTLEWFTRQEDTSGVVRVVVPGGILAKSVQPLTFQSGAVRAVQPAQRAGGAEVTVLRAERDAGVRTFALKHPDRIVIDILASSSTASDQQTAQEGAGSPSGLPSAVMAPSAPPGEAGPIPSLAETLTLANQASTEPFAPETSRQRVSARTTLPMTGGTGGRPTGGPGVLTIVLDPGHGGQDAGAIGPSGLMEKDVVLDLALRLRRLLTERLGVRVIMTRSEDVFIPLQERTAIANRARADFFLSLHLNGATKRGAGGFETFYFTREPSDSDARASAQRENLVIETNGAAGKDLDSLLRITLADMAVTRDMRESGELAQIVLSYLQKLLKVESRGVKSGPFYVLATAAMPAILVESAFITNPKEERKLQQGAYRQRIAEALYEGIARYKVRYERRVGMGSGASSAADS
jgi:N-acetylmuramoyl-L-alanine amidase